MKLKYGLIIGLFFIISIFVYLFGYNQGLQRPVVNLPDGPTPNPTETPEALTPEPEISSEPVVTVPEGWREHTAEDWDLGVKTTLSLPPDYIFKFTGSEFIIYNLPNAREIWAYATSVYRTESGSLINRYTGSSRRLWYQEYFSNRNSVDKIIAIEEKSLNQSTYLKITVKTQLYDDHGVPSGTRNCFHYVYVQNKILHMITPSSDNACNNLAQIPSIIEPILLSLSSSQTVLK